ncbi:MAG: hypothetical protein DSY80_11170 [Desulfocapsa sp.]|nr:MAG: hypothetical protein DSY80_11170 [Desulfocapsa sp.]
MRILITFLALIFLSELSLQIYHYYFPTTIFYRHSYEENKGKPNGEDYDFHLNSLGFKDTEFTQKKEGTYRILAIGDSFAFGTVPYQGLFLTLLEKKLHQITPGIELLNMGIPGIAPHEYYYLLGLEGIGVQPDMLLLTFFIGDDFSSSKPKKFYDYSALGAIGKQILDKRKTYHGKIYHHGTYCDTCPPMPIENFLAIEEEKRYLFEKDNSTFAKHFENAKYSLRRIRKQCNRENIQLLVVVIPDAVQINTSLEKQIRAGAFSPVANDSWDISQSNRILTNWMISEGIDFIDLYPYMKNNPAPVYKPNDVHWNLAGNKLASEVICSKLLTCGLGKK